MEHDGHDGREGDPDGGDGKHGQATQADRESAAVAARLARRGARRPDAAPDRVRRLAGESRGAAQLHHHRLLGNAERHRRANGGQVRRVARLFALHALERGAQLPRPETGRWRNPDRRLRAGDRPPVAPVPVRSTVLQAPATERWPGADARRAAAGAHANAPQLAMHAGASDRRVSRSNPFYTL